MIDSVTVEERYVPMVDVPRGLTVVPAGHRDEYQAAAAEFGRLAARYFEADAALLAVIWGRLYRAHIQPLCEQVDAARAHAAALEHELGEARAQLAAHEQATAVAATARAQRAERRDKTLRETVHRRDGDQCRYCGTGAVLGGRGARGAVLDHVDPSVAGVADNLVVACRPCRRRKGPNLLEDAGMRLQPPPQHPILHPVPEVAAPAVTAQDCAGRDTVPAGCDADSGADRAGGPVGVQTWLTVTYPDGVIARVQWPAERAPTVGELLDMIDALAVVGEPVEVTVSECAVGKLTPRAQTSVGTGRGLPVTR